MRFEGPAYRGHNPKWSFAPTSGAGAAIHGGRFNPKGLPALYLALTPQGAFLEATQGFAYKFNPLTLVSYTVDCADIVDLTDPAGEIEDAGTLMATPWAYALASGKRPESWQIYDRLHATHAGVIVPSFAVGAEPFMRNLVLWRWSDTGPHRVAVHDPHALLPRDQASWT